MGFWYLWPCDEPRFTLQGFGLGIVLITSDMILVTSSNYTYVSDIVLIRDCDGWIPAPE